MQLTLLGAARQVTGSCFLFEAGQARFLVDCGMFQGPRQVEAANARPFAFDPARLDFVLLTHAHIDHSGLLPRLAAQGFAGPVYTTAATIDLLGVMLPDSAWLQQMEYERAQRHGRKAPAPLYSLEQAEQALAQCRAVPYDEWREAAPGISFRLRDAGHILGSAIVELQLAAGGRTCRVVVSGDLGQPGQPILRDPARIERADLLLVESTYGNRNHRSLEATLEEFVQTVQETVGERGGNLIVPSFAVGRTQEILYWFNALTREGRLPPLRIYVDSPMATKVTHITARHLELFDEEARRMARTPPPGGAAPVVRFVGTAEESKALNRIEGGAVIIAASGMCEGGRIRHHLRHQLPDSRTTVMITGFQAQGTLGRALVDGARHARIFGEDVPVRARVVTLGGFSAHADQRALTDWLRGFRQPPGRTLLVHGEEGVQQAFQRHVAAELGWQCQIPAEGDTVALSPLAGTGG